MFSAIQWPGGLSEQSFLDHYWQKKALLIRQAFPGFTTPVSPDELAGLALEPDTTPRLILKSGSGNYVLEHGPFEASRFASLNDNNWSLLVTDVEKHVPELIRYIDPFRFLPHWRIDDLMISYAPNGASVGAHVDQYDVFLLQASGERQWMIDTSDNPNVKLQTESELKLLANFNANETHTLEPGDMLYLPPGVPHHGVAVSENCTTWSLGFRTPSDAEMLMSFAEAIAANHAKSQYKDPALSIANPGEIDATAIEQFAARWRELSTLSQAQLSHLTGTLLTTSPGVDDRGYYDLADSPSGQWQKLPFCRAAYIDNGADVTLFADSVSYEHCSKTFAQTFCTDNILDYNTVSAGDQPLFEQLLSAGVLMPVE